MIPNNPFCVRLQSKNQLAFHLPTILRTLIAVLSSVNGDHETQLKYTMDADENRGSY